MFLYTYSFDLSVKFKLGTKLAVVYETQFVSTFINQQIIVSKFHTHLADSSNEKNIFFTYIIINNRLPTIGKC